MELKLLPYQLPDKLGFNYEELKAELVAKTEMYETMVYTDDQIKDARSDRANLNKLKKALNDERIRMEREYMQPFNDFKAKINDLIKIIDKPVLVIDKQVKEYEEQQMQKKIDEVKEYFESLPPIEGFEDLQFEQIINPRWRNASVSMRAIHDEISGIRNRIKDNLATLAKMPEIGFEAIEVYKTTLDLNQALNEGRRLAEIQKRKEEQERLKAEEEAKKQEEQLPGQVVFTDAKLFEECMNPPVVEVPEQPQEEAEWISFRALLTETNARALKGFFESRNIQFEAI